jgi:glucosamine-6-phosphate deaminase
MPNISIEVLDTPHDAELRVAALVAAKVRANPRAVLGLATGRSMIAVYAHLVREHQDRGLQFADCTSFNLDEYCELSASHPASFESYMRTHLFDRVDFNSQRWHLPDPAGIPEATAAYEAAIRDAGGIDLQLLGVGRNGHIGFNEPGSSFQTRTRKVTLAESTRTANAPDFPPGESVPHAAVTMGIATILDARSIVLLATGAAKADALSRALRQSPNTDCPASALQMHDDVTVICDPAAAATLEVHA